MPGRSIFVITSYSIHYTKLYEDDALALTFKAYRQAPFESGVLDTLGMVLEKFGRHNEAVAAFEMAYRFAKGNPTISFHLGQSLVITSYSIHYTKLYDGACR